MNGLRLLMLLAATTVATHLMAADSNDKDTGVKTTDPAAIQPASQPAAKFEFDDALRSKLSSGSVVGLKPQTERAKDGISLPFGMNYNRDTRSLLVPLDQKNAWGVGLNLDVNASRSVELAPPTSTLGLQPKRTPGVMLQKKF